MSLFILNWQKLLEGNIHVAQKSRGRVVFQAGVQCWCGRMRRDALSNFLVMLLDHLVRKWEGARDPEKQDDTSTASSFPSPPLSFLFFSRIPGWPQTLEHLTLSLYIPSAGMRWTH